MTTKETSDYLKEIEKITGFPLEEIVKGNLCLVAGSSGIEMIEKAKEIYEKLISNNYQGVNEIENDLRELKDKSDFYYFFD